MKATLGKKILLMFYIPFFIIFGMMPIFVTIAATLILVFGARFLLLVYIGRKISKPINQLTFAADAITRGDIETDIGYYSIGYYSDREKEVVPPTVLRLKSVEGLDVDSALSGVDGQYDVYVKSVKLTARLMPETIDKMIIYLSEENMKSFTSEVHGLKSVLRNIGAAELGNKAAQLEKAALGGRIDYCHEHYPPFQDLLTEFMRQMNMAIAADDTTQKEKIDRQTLLTALKEAKLAVESYDAMQALDIMKPVSSYSYNEEIDELLEKVIFALEEFDCQGALTNILIMEVSFNETH